MPIFSFKSGPAPESQPALTPANEKTTLLETEPTISTLQTASVPGNGPNGTQASPPVTSSPASSSPDISAHAAADKRQSLDIRRFSFRTFSFTSVQVTSKATATAKKSDTQDAQRHTASAGRAPRVSSSDKRAKESALILRTLIVGPDLSLSPQATKASAAPQLTKVKTQLMEPKSANKVIAQLRALPISDATDAMHMSGPIHAVCLEHTDEEEEKINFSQLAAETSHQELAVGFINVPSVKTASMNALMKLFTNMRIVNLITAPDLGLGQPGDGDGILAGAVPTAETIINGVEQITPQLLAIGYATGKAIYPNHAGIYPPTDRMSVLTYWWGLELVLPPPSIKNLASAHSVSGTIINFLTALAMVNNGVREILPFVRYISQYVDFEFSTIKAQDKGKGVVCAATWIMPAAMVPRPWDFPPPPTTKPTLSAPSAKTSGSLSAAPSGVPHVVVISPTASAESVPSKATATS